MTSYCFADFIFLWTSISDEFYFIFCSTNAGCIALPALLNIKQVMQQRQVTGVWNTRDELPVYFSCYIL